MHVGAVHIVRYVLNDWRSYTEQVHSYVGVKGYAHCRQPHEL